MNIFYKHKETGAKISLEEIKQNPDFKGGAYKNIITFKKGERVSCSTKTYSYKLRDIPLSDDFEIEIEGNPYDLDIDDIYCLIYTINNSTTFPSNRQSLKDKLIKIYKNLQHSRMGN